MARKTEKLVLPNIDVELEDKYLLVENVPVRSYLKDDNNKSIPDAKGNPTYDLYHVDIRFANFEDILTMAVGKVKHTVGHAIKEGKILKDEEGRTLVDSTGYPPKSAIEKVADLATAVRSTTDAKSKAQLKKMLQALLKEM